MKDYIIQGTNEINKLKQNLMTDKGKTITPSSIKETTTISNKDNDEKRIRKIATEEVRRIINERIGKKFEDNIRDCLEYEFDFQQSPMEIHLEVREIKIKNKIGSQFVEKNQNLEIELNGKIVSFGLNNDFSVSITDKKTGTIIEKILDEETKIKTKIFGVDVVIYKHIEMEFDGVFTLGKCFDKKAFEEKKVKILYEKIENNKKYDMAMVESKLNINEIGDLIRQIKRNNIYFKKKYKNNVIHLGFINGTNVNLNIHLKDKLKGIECIIFGLKNSRLCGRNMENCIDWALKKKLDKLESLLLGKKTKRQSTIKEEKINVFADEEDFSKIKFANNKSIQPIMPKSDNVKSTDAIEVKLTRRKEKKRKAVNSNIK